MKSVSPLLLVFLFSVGRAGSASQQQSIEKQVGEALGTQDFKLVSLQLPAALPDEFRVALRWQGNDRILDLRRRSVRSVGFRARIQNESGEFEEQVAPQSVTYRGEVLDDSTALAAASLLPTGLRAMVASRGQPTLFIEPLADVIDGSFEPWHVVYQRVETTDVVCGNDLLKIPGTLRLPLQGVGSSPMRGGSCLQVAEVAFDADYEYYQTSGSSVAAVLMNIESALNAANVIYERDVAITHQMGDVLVRASEPDPYSGTDAGVILSAFQNNWNNNHGSIQRDAAHLITGRGVMNQGIIGLAFVGVVCNLSSAYGLSSFSFSFGTNVDILAHELGHNWNAPHCLDPGGIMCGGGTAGGIGEITEGVMLAYRDSVNCLQVGAGAVDPLPPNARPDQASVADSVTVDVLDNDLDGNCDVVSIASFDTVSAGGGAVLRSVATGPGGRDELIYTAPFGFLGADEFTYTADDGQGGQDQATVQVFSSRSKLVAHFRLDELQGNIAFDSAGNNLDAVYRPGTTKGQPGAATGTATSVDFDGVTGRVRIFDAPPLTQLTSDTSVMAWINPDNLTGKSRIFGNFGCWVLGLTSSYLVFSKVQIQDYNLLYSIPTNTWTHVAVVFDADFDVTFYVNGSVVGTVAGSGPSGSPGQKWFVGTLDNQAEFFDGKIDDLQVYRGSLTAEQIQYAYEHPGVSVCGSDWRNYGQGIAGTLGVPNLTASADPILGSTIELQIGNSSSVPTVGMLMIGTESSLLDSGAGPHEMPVFLVHFEGPVFGQVLVLPVGGVQLQYPVANEGTSCRSIYMQVMEHDLGSNLNWSFSRGLELLLGF